MFQKKESNNNLKNLLSVKYNIYILEYYILV